MTASLLTCQADRNHSIVISHLLWPGKTGQINNNSVNEWKYFSPGQFSYFPIFLFSP